MAQIGWVQCIPLPIMGYPEPGLVLLSLCPPLSLSPQSEVDIDYLDPFDAQPHQPHPDDSYMEPYDAQRVVSGE